MNLLTHCLQRTTAISRHFLARDLFRLPLYKNKYYFYSFIAFVFRFSGCFISFDRRVQTYNVDSLMACALPSHDTKLFGRVCHLVVLKSTRWEFLQQVSRTLSPMPRTMLADQCVKDRAVLNFILGMAMPKSMMQKSSASMDAPHPTTVAFVAATLREALVRAKSSAMPALMQAVLPATHDFLTSDDDSRRALGLVVFVTASSKVRLESKALRSLVDSATAAASKLDETASKDRIPGSVPLGARELLAALAAVATQQARLEGALVSKFATRTSTVDQRRKQETRLLAAAQHGWSGGEAAVPPSLPEA